MFCTNCGREVPFKTKICPFCSFEIIIEEEYKQDYEEDKILEPGVEAEEEAEENLDTSLTNEGQVVTKISDSGASRENCQKFNSYNKYDMPLSTASFFFMQLVFLIPFINLFLLLIWAFKKNTNHNRKAYARSILIWFLSISVILLFVFVIMLFMRYPIDVGFWFQEFKSFINSIPEF